MNMPQGTLRPFHPASPALRIVGETESAETCLHAGTGKRVLVYSHDTFGLGNIRRMLAIAERLVKDDPEVHVLVITGSPMLHSFRISPQIDFIKLPCLSRDTDGKYQVRSLPMSYQHTLLMRSQIINSAIEMYKPHLILVDKKPLGVAEELRPALLRLKRMSKRPALALVLRDILDAPETTRQIWAKHDYHGIIRQCYDMLLVVGQPEIFDLAHEYHFPEASRQRLRYCGYIHHKKSADHYSNRNTRPTAFSVLVAAGGGGDGFPLIQAYLQGLQRRLSGLQLHSTVITGPEMPADLQASLREQAKGIPNLELLEFSPRMEEQLAKADLVICMGGYNTLCETVVNRKRTIVIPRTRPVEEQWLRASNFANRGLLDTIHPDSLTPEILMQTVDRALANPANDELPDVLDFNGLERMHYWVNHLLEKQLAETTKEETFSCMHS